MSTASAGSTPAASLKLMCEKVPMSWLRDASAGSTPAASLKLCAPNPCVAVSARIRGVYPRGLIEATGWRAVVLDPARGRIRGVYPRGLIEAAPAPEACRRFRRRASAGSTPAASLKLSRVVGSRHGGSASAGSTPAASLKPSGTAVDMALDEWASAGSTPAASLKPVLRGFPCGRCSGGAEHPRGLPPRPH